LGSRSGNTRRDFGKRKKLKAKKEREELIEDELELKISTRMNCNFIFIISTFGEKGNENHCHSCGCDYTPILCKVTEPHILLDGDGICSYHIVKFIK